MKLLIAAALSTSLLTSGATANPRDQVELIDADFQQVCRARNPEMGLRIARGLVLSTTQIAVMRHACQGNQQCVDRRRRDLYNDHLSGLERPVYEPIVPDGWGMVVRAEGMPSFNMARDDNIFGGGGNLDVYGAYVLAYSVSTCESYNLRVFTTDSGFRAGNHELTYHSNFLWLDPDRTARDDWKFKLGSFETDTVVFFYPMCGYSGRERC